MSIKIGLRVQDPAMRMTLDVMLKTAGYQTTCAAIDVVITDDIGTAVREAATCPALLLTPLSKLPEAVAAMREGVFGYITVPLIPDEAILMIERATASPSRDCLQDDEERLEIIEKRHILKILRACKGNQVKAACRLGIGRNTLWRKLKHYAALEQSSSPNRGNDDPLTGSKPERSFQ